MLNSPMHVRNQENVAMLEPKGIFLGQIVSRFLAQIGENLVQCGPSGNGRKYQLVRRGRLAQVKRVLITVKIEKQEINLIPKVFFNCLPGNAKKSYFRRLFSFNRESGLLFVIKERMLECHVRFQASVGDSNLQRLLAESGHRYV